MMTRPVITQEVPTTFAPLVLRYAASRGCDTIKLARRHGFADAAQQAVLVHALPHQIVNLCDAVAKDVNDDHFGLSMAKVTWEGIFQTGPEPGLLGYLVRNAPTVKDAILGISRYERLFTLASTFRIYFEKQGASIHFAETFESEQGAGRHHHEWQVGVSLEGIKNYLGAPVTVERVWFRNKAPRDTKRLRHEWSTSNLEFDASTTGYFIGKKTLEAQGKNVDPQLYAVLERQAAALIKPLERKEDLRGQLRATLQREFQSEGRHFNQQHIAQIMGMSVRTLQRKLEESNESFSNVFDEVRREIAKFQLSSSRLSLAEVARFLRFSDAKSFVRSFRRWEGCTPKAYRSRNTN